MSRTIHPVLPDEDDRWEIFDDDAMLRRYTGLRWRDLETVCKTVEYLSVDADPLRTALRHESGEYTDSVPHDFTLTREEIEQLHVFTRDAIGVVEEAYDVDAIFEQYEAAYIDESTADPPSDQERDAWKTWTKLRQLRDLTEVALEFDFGLEVG